MTVLVATVVFDYLLSALFVSCALAILARTFSWSLRGLIPVVALTLVFGILDVYYVPALIAVDATITIRNPDISGPLGLSPDMPLLQALGLEYYDWLIWLGQAVIARYLAIQFIQTKVRYAA